MYLQIYIDYTFKCLRITLKQTVCVKNIHEVVKGAASSIKDVIF